MHGKSFKNMQSRKHVGTDMQSYIYQFSKVGTAKGGGGGGGDEGAGGKTNAGATTIQPLHKGEEGGGGAQAAGAGISAGSGAGAGAGAILPLPAEVLAEDPDAPDPQKAFPCTLCSKSFAKLRGLQTHTRQVHELQKYGADWKPSKKKTLPCPVCSRKYHDKESLWQHVVSKHSLDGDSAINPGPLTEAEQQIGEADVEFVPCNICGQAVPSAWHIDQHLEMLKPLCGMKAACMVCGRTFMEHRALRQHLNFCRLKDPEHETAEVIGQALSVAAEAEAKKEALNPVHWTSKGGVECHVVSL